MSRWAESIEIIEVLLDFLSNKRLVRLIANGDLDEVAADISKADKIIEKLGVLPGEKRAALLAKLLLEDFSSLSARQIAKRVENIRFILRDFLKTYDFIIDQAGIVEVGDFKISKGADLVAEFNKNLSTGLKQSYRRLKAYLANNHLLGKLLTDPSFLLSDITGRVGNLNSKFGYQIRQKFELIVRLENKPDSANKIDDLYVMFMLPEFRLNVNGTLVELDDIMEFVRVSVDSKFFMDPSRIADSAKLFQQSALTLGDKVGQLFEVYRRLKDSYLSLEEIREVLEELVPLIFQHYVVIPPDRAIRASVNAKYVEFISEDAVSHILATIEDLFPEMSTEMKDMIIEIVLKHIDDHFGSGNFILKHDLQYNDIPL